MRYIVLFVLVSFAAYAQSILGDNYTLAKMDESAFSILDGGSLLVGSLKFGTDAGTPYYYNQTGSTVGRWVSINQLPTQLGICGQSNAGMMVQRLGGPSEGATKICVCSSDGAASPAYAWCSLTMTNGSAVVCAGGSASVCP